VNTVCKFLIENNNLKNLLALILYSGNYLNGGNAQKGQADGFDLEILAKLKDVKSNDPKITLLHFIVKSYIDQNRVSCTVDDMEIPIPDPECIKKCTDVEYADCDSILAKSKTDLQSIILRTIPK
jgi:hypothetical protein